MPSVELITKDDLHNFKQDLLTEITALLKVDKPIEQWLKSADVRKMLKISPGTLQSLRASGALPFSKLNGTIYYRASDVQQALQRNMQNA